MALCTALIVDDSKTIRTAHSKMLVKLGYDVTQAENGKEGLDWILKRRFNVVLCDLDMPQMDGLEMITSLRQFEAEHDEVTPQLVICVSGGHPTHGTETEAVALEAGMDAFKMKPLRLSVLKDLLSEHLDPVNGSASRSTSADLVMGDMEGELSLDVQTPVPV